MLFYFADEDMEKWEISITSMQNSKQTSYSHGRKKSTNHLSDLFNLPFHVLIFRCGWAAKNIHSAFDYVFNSSAKDEACGHALAGWKDVSSKQFQKNVILIKIF